MWRTRITISHGKRVILSDTHTSVSRRDQHARDTTRILNNLAQRVPVDVPLDKLSFSTVTKWQGAQRRGE